jgi:hypothetical protein
VTESPRGYNGGGGTGSLAERMAMAGGKSNVGNGSVRMLGSP